MPSYDNGFGGAVAGIVVGCVAAIIIAAVSIWLCVRRRRRNRQRQLQAQGDRSIDKTGNLANFEVDASYPLVQQTSMPRATPYTAPIPTSTGAPAPSHPAEKSAQAEAGFAAAGSEPSSATAYSPSSPHRSAQDEHGREGGVGKVHGDQGFQHKWEVLNQGQGAVSVGPAGSLPGGTNGVASTSGVPEAIQHVEEDAGRVEQAGTLPPSRLRIILPGEIRL